MNWLTVICVQLTISSFSFINLKTQCNPTASQRAYKNIPQTSAWHIQTVFSRIDYWFPQFFHFFHREKKIQLSAQKNIYFHMQGQLLTWWEFNIQSSDWCKKSIFGVIFVRFTALRVFIKTKKAWRFQQTNGNEMWRSWKHFYCTDESKNSSWSLSIATVINALEILKFHG